MKLGCTSGCTTALLLALAFFVLGSTPASARPHQLFLDFDSDNNVWTINPFADGNPVTFVLDVGDDGPWEGGDALLFFDLGCWFDPYSMETVNCAQIECDWVWGAPEVLHDCWTDCPPAAECYDVMLTGLFEEGFAPVAGERYRIGTEWITRCGPGEFCAGGSYFLTGHIAGTDVRTNEIWLDPAPAAIADDAPAVEGSTWGKVRALNR